MSLSRGVGGGFRVSELPARLTFLCTGAEAFGFSWFQTAMARAILALLPLAQPFGCTEVDPKGPFSE